MSEEQHDEGVAEFGWEAPDKPVSGRRKKLQKKIKPGSFETMGLSAEVLRAIKRKGYRLPTPIQRRTTPLILQGLDVVGMARTGSGKTAAFVLPMLVKLKAHSGRAGARAVILSPTRELALQTHKVVQELGRYGDLRTAVLVGGDSMEAQFAELASFPDILVATPGRLMHHLQEVEGMSLKSVEYLVFDEADRLFEMGFAEQLCQIMAAMGPQRQTLLFSATMPKALAEFARAGLRDPELVRLDADTKISPDLQLAFFTVRAEDKPAALLYLLQEVLPPEQATIVFTSTRHHVEFLQSLLAKEGIDAAYVHGNMDQAARKIHIAKFRAGRVKHLIVTDVAARGIDIPLLDNVVNYDFPPKPKLFVHRSGRAARAGRSGVAYSLLTRDELPFLIDLHLFLSRPLTPAPVRGLREAAAAAADLPRDSSVYGCFPQAALADMLDHVRNTLEACTELASQLTSASNAFKLYTKTRPPAATESAKRARALPQEGIHPLLAAAVPSDALGGLEAQSGLAEISAALKSYRPAQTVFEAEMAPARRGVGAGTAAIPGAVPAERNIEVMRQKRAAHAQVIQATKKRSKLMADADGRAAAGMLLPGRGASIAGGNSSEGRAESDLDEDCEGSEKDGEGQQGGDEQQDAKQQQDRRGRTQRQFVLAVEPEAGRFREAGFYVSHLPKENDTGEKFYALGDGGLKDAVLDLTAEDAAGMRTQQARYHWDKRSKKYVKLQASETVKAGKRVKTESGAKARAKGGKEGTGVYKKWVKAHKLRVPAAGEEEGGGGHATGAQMGDRFKHGGRGWKNPFRQDAKPNAGVRDELRRPEQVRKARKLEESKKEHLQKRKMERRVAEKRGAGGSGKGGRAGGKGGFGGGGKSGGRGGTFGARGGVKKPGGKR